MFFSLKRKLIEIGIVDDEDYQKNEQFMIELGEPVSEEDIDENDAGRAHLGVRTQTTVTIREGKVVKGIVDQLLSQKANAALVIGTSSWTEQFKDAFNVEVDDEDEEEGDEPKEPKKPTTSDYVMHFLNLPWKLTFAIIPPTGKLLNDSFNLNYGNSFVVESFHLRYQRRISLFLGINCINWCLNCSNW